MSSRAGPGRATNLCWSKACAGCYCLQCSQIELQHRAYACQHINCDYFLCNSHLHKCKWDYSGFPNWSPGSLCKLNCGKTVVFPKSHELWKRKGELLKRFGKMFLKLRLHIHSGLKWQFSTYLRVEEMLMADTHLSQIKNFREAERKWWNWPRKHNVASVE